MEDTDIIEARDINGNPITIGISVRYVNRNTVGNVVDIKEDEEGVWALLDATDLYYKVDALEVIGAMVAKEEAEKVATESEIEEYVKGQEEAATAEELSNVTGGG